MDDYDVEDFLAEEESLYSSPGGDSLLIFVIVLYMIGIILS